MSQLDLFPSDRGADEAAKLIPYWRGSLALDLVHLVEFRNFRNTSSWSMACQGIWFAQLLTEHGAMPLGTYVRLRKLWRTACRRNRMRERPTCLPTYNSAIRRKLGVL